MIRNYLTEAINKQLLKVVGDFHLFRNEFSQNPNSIWVCFEGLKPIRIFGASDGECILIDQTPPLPMNFGESGETVTRDMSRNLFLAQCLKKKLLEAWTVESPKDHIVGIRFDFGQSHKPMVINWGDELLISEAYPMDAKGQSIFEIPVVVKTVN